MRVRAFGRSESRARHGRSSTILVPNQACRLTAAAPDAAPRRTSWLEVIFAAAASEPRRLDRNHFDIARELHERTPCIRVAYRRSARAALRGERRSRRRVGGLFLSPCRGRLVELEPVRCAY